jgi:hypothetical protein
LKAHRTWLDIIDTCDNANHLIHEIEERSWQEIKITDETRKSFEKIHEKQKLASENRIKRLRETALEKIQNLNQLMEEIKVSLE